MNLEKQVPKRAGGTKGWALLFAGEPAYTAWVAEELARRRYDLLLVCAEPHAQPWQAIRQSFAWQGLACQVLKDSPAVFLSWLEGMEDNPGSVQAMIDLSPAQKDSPSSLLPHKQILKTMIPS
jgi:hypothetical protein